MKRNRRNTLLWMKDLLDHMSRCHDQLQWASDGDTAVVSGGCPDRRSERVPETVRAAPRRPVA